MRRLPLTPAQVGLVSVASGCCHATVQRWLKGHDGHRAQDNAIREALRGLDLHPVRLDPMARVDQETAQLLMEAAAHRDAQVAPADLRDGQVTLGKRPGGAQPPLAAVDPLTSLGVTYAAPGQSQQTCNRRLDHLATTSASIHASNATAHTPPIDRDNIAVAADPTPPACHIPGPGGVDVPVRVDAGLSSYDPPYMVPIASIAAPPPSEPRMGVGPSKSRCHVTILDEFGEVVQP